MSSLLSEYSNIFVMTFPTVQCSLLITELSSSNCKKNTKVIFPLQIIKLGMNRTFYYYYTIKE